MLHRVPPGHPDAFEALVEHGADTEARGAYGCTVLHKVAGARFEDDARSVDVLISGGAATKARNNKDRTPLHCASYRLNLGAMRALLRSGADLRARDDDGRSPLQLAVSGVDLDAIARVADAVDLLLRRGADETATSATPSDGSDGSEDSEDDLSGETAAEVWELEVARKGISAADATPVRRLLADAPKGRAWRRRGWLVLARARADRVQLKATSGGTAITGRRARSVRARGAAAAAGAASSGGAQAGPAAPPPPPRGRPGRGLSGVVAAVVALQEDGVFRNIVEFL